MTHGLSYFAVGNAWQCVLAAILQGPLWIAYTIDSKVYTRHCSRSFALQFYFCKRVVLPTLFFFFYHEAFCSPDLPKQSEILSRGLKFGLHIPGASAAYLWEAADQPWQTKSDDLNGIIRSNDTYKKPGYEIMKQVFPFIPLNAYILKTGALASDISTAVFNLDKILTVVVVNAADFDQTVTLSVHNAVASSCQAYTWAANNGSTVSTATKNSFRYINTNLYSEFNIWTMTIKTFVDSLATVSCSLAPWPLLW